MKTRIVKASELKKGDVVYDVHPDITGASKMEFSHKNNQIILFKPIGQCFYGRDENGFVPFINNEKLKWWIQVKELQSKPIRKNTQRTALIRAFIEKPNLTAITAFQLTGSMKLSTRVHEFEDMGLKFKKEPIQFKTRYGTSGRYVKYTLVNKSVAKKLLKDLQNG